MLSPAEIEALLIASGGFLSVGIVLLVLILLGTPDGLRKAGIFSAGWLGTHVLVGWAACLLGSRMDGGGGASGWLSVGLGLVLLALAAHKTHAMRKPTTGPGFLARMDRLSLLQVAALGVVVPIANLKNLAIFLTAVAALMQEDLAPVRLGMGVLAVSIVFCVVPMLPALAAWAFPGASARVLAILRARLQQHGDWLALGILVGFGLLFLARGSS